VQAVAAATARQVATETDAKAVGVARHAFDTANAKRSGGAGPAQPEPEQAKSKAKTPAAVATAPVPHDA